MSSQPLNRVVIHYHEVALKRGNRRLFVEQLRSNVRLALRGTGVRKVRSIPGRLIVNLQPDANWEEIRKRLEHTFGVVNYAPAWKAERTREGMIETALAAVEGLQPKSFRVRAKRGDKRFPIPSMEVARFVGQAIGEKHGWPVDLNNAELSVHVEIPNEQAFVSVDPEPGPGGLPVGTGGKVLALLSGGIDSPVAAYRMMKRGCEVSFVHFHGAPFQDRSSIDKVLELAATLMAHQPQTELRLVAFGEVQRQIVATAARPYRVVLYRRMMMRIAEAIAEQTGAKALVSGESLGQVASQTLENMTVVGAATTLPLLRPLVGMDKLEISDQSERIGTFEISIRPDQDCCQLFVPKHPSTKMTVKAAEDAEAELDIPQLIDDALADVEVCTFGKARRRPAPATSDSKVQATIPGATLESS